MCLRSVYVYTFPAVKDEIVMHGGLVVVVGKSDNGRRPPPPPLSPSDPEGPIIAKARNADQRKKGEISPTRAMQEKLSLFVTPFLWGLFCSQENTKNVGS